MNAYLLNQKLAQDPLVRNVDSIFSRLRLSPEQFARLSQDPGLKAKSEPIVQRYVNQNKKLIQVTLKGEPSSKTVRSWLRIQE
ncbi:hypothetical protein A8990_14728 [Paenibacillus taihuensis]|uniref:Uncharacterized protein n=2 Tax=Paenibacillus taihuensis TaxID=1156355 RepID=A0A3D9QTP1_9BACL|nr:hypothetical protein A8990_14728 [Paenibacillus taihuensis]